MILHRLQLLLNLLLLLSFPSPSSWARPLPNNFEVLPPSFEKLVAGVWAEFKSLLDAGLGDMRSSIVPLKRYFARFGYLNLPAESQNVTNLFDSATMAALKLYQQSYHLPVTGRLDMATLAKIMTPRCGREDVADGIPLMLRNNTTAMAHSVEEWHYSFFPAAQSWPSTRRNLSYAFSPINETSRMSSNQRRQAFRSAFGEWASIIPLNFTEIDDYDAADIKIKFVSFSHGDIEPFDGVLGILAHAFSPVDGRFHLDDSEYWYSASDGAGNEPQDIDLQSVVMHEIGHLIGLGHSPVENSIMYPSLGPGQVKLQLQQDDIEGAQVLYGVNPDYDPSKPFLSAPPLVGVGNINGAYKSGEPWLLCLAVCFLALLALL